MSRIAGIALIGALFLAACMLDSHGLLDGSPRPDGDGDGDMDTDIEGDADSDSDSDIEDEPDSDLDADGDLDSPRDADRDQEVDSEADADSDADLDDDIDADDAAPDGDSDVDGDWDAETDSDPEETADADPDLDPDVEPDADEPGPTGEGEDCLGSDDCHESAPHCVWFTCYDGSEGDPCVELMGHCSASAPYCVSDEILSAHCYDGSLGDPCERGADCGDAAPYCEGGICSVFGEGYPRRLSALREKPLSRRRFRRPLR